MARAAVLKLWEFMRKAAVVHIGYRKGVAPVAVGKLLDHNAYTECPSADSQKGDVTTGPVLW